jgi:DNA-binding NarL/FixJ family response regulator
LRLAALSPTRAAGAGPHDENKAEMPSPTADRSALRVLVVDDHEVLRLGVRHLLGQLDRPVETIDAADLDMARAALAAGRFDLLLLDLSLGEDFALQALPRLREAAGTARIVVLTSLAEQIYAERALKAGADGFVMKSELGSTLLDAVRTVLAGQVYLSPGQRSEMLRRLTGRAGSGERPTLSARELEVLRLVAAGRSTREIAERLNRSVKTIETHKQTLKTKLGAETPAQLMRHALAWFGTPP